MDGRTWRASFCRHLIGGSTAGGRQIMGIRRCQWWFMGGLIIDGCCRNNACGCRGTFQGHHEQTVWFLVPWSAWSLWNLNNNHNACIEVWRLQTATNYEAYYSEVGAQIKTRITLLLTRIMSFHVYVLERYDICMVRCDAQRRNSTNHAYVISL